MVLVQTDPFGRGVEQASSALASALQQRGQQQQQINQLGALQQAFQAIDEEAPPAEQFSSLLGALKESDVPLDPNTALNFYKTFDESMRQRNARTPEERATFKENQKLLAGISQDAKVATNLMGDLDTIHKAIESGKTAGPGLKGTTARTVRWLNSEGPPPEEQTLDTERKNAILALGDLKGIRLTDTKLRFLEESLFNPKKSLGQNKEAFRIYKDALQQRVAYLNNAKSLVQDNPDILYDPTFSVLIQDTDTPEQNDEQTQSFADMVRARVGKKMSIAADLKQLKEEGYTDDDILNTIYEMAPNIKEDASTLLQEGYTPDDIITTFLETKQTPQATKEQAVEEPEKVKTKNFGQDVATGAAIGGLDLLDLARLAGRGAEKLTNLPRYLAGRAIKNVTGLETNLTKEPSSPFKAEGPVASILDKAREKIPEGGLTQEISRRVARSVPLALGGPLALATGVGSELTGLGARKVAEGIGFGETGQTIADVGAGILGGGQVAHLGGRALQQAEKLVPRVARTPATGLEKQLTKAEILASPKKVQKDLSKISSNAIRQYEENVGRLAEPTYVPSKFNARSIEDSIVKETRDAALNSISPAERGEAAWNKISEGVNTELAAERDFYRGLYRSAENQAKKMNYTFSKTADQAKSLLDDLGRLVTKSKSQPGVERALQTTLEDIGVRPTNKDLTKVVGNVLEEYKSPSIAANDLQRLIEGQAPISVDKAMALKRSLNDIINYEDLSPGIKDLLRPLVRTLKNETLEALNQRPLVKAAYRKAESQFAQTANTFDKDAINFLRAKDAPETAASKFLVGSNLKYLKKALKNSPEEWSAVESQVVREISKKSTDAGREILKEVEPYLSQNSKKVAEDLIKFGDKLTSPGAQSAMRGKLLESIQSAASTGVRPDYALKLMQNPTGYKFTENLLNKSPKGKEMWKALQKQSVDDIFRSILDKNNAIDFNKAKDLIKNSHVERIIKDATGEKGLNFFKKLEGYSKNITKNMKEFTAKAPPSLREQFVNSTSLSLKSLMSAFVGGKIGLLGYLGLKTVPKMSSSIFYKILASPKLQGLVKQLSNPITWKSGQVIPVVQKLNTGLEKDKELKEDLEKSQDTDNK